MEVIQEAISIASRDLRWCYREKGTISGSRLVYWSWDSFFAGLGSMRIGDGAQVRKNLDLYLSLQREDGAIPKRIAHPWYWTKFLGVPIKEHPDKQKPTFSTSYYTAESLTQNPVLVIALHDYVTQSGDTEYFQRHKESLEKLFAYLAAHEDSQGLLKEGLGGGWAESVLKRGAISFTNMCYARAFFCMADLCGGPWKKLYEQKKQEINRRLWSDDDGGYYSDWHDHQRHHHFATDGNLLAIWWDIASPEQAAKIQAKIAALDLESDIPIKLAYDPYDFWRIYIFNRIGGMKDYHVGFSWTWLGCIDAVAKLRLGKKEEARSVLERIAAVIVRDGTVHEAYNNGKAVHTPFYKSENPWGWGAGLFLYACSEAGYH